MCRIEANRIDFNMNHRQSPELLYLFYLYINKASFLRLPITPVVYKILSIMISELESRIEELEKVMRNIKRDIEIYELKA